MSNTDFEKALRAAAFRTGMAASAVATAGLWAADVMDVATCLRWPLSCRVQPQHAFVATVSSMGLSSSVAIMISRPLASDTG